MKSVEATATASGRRHGFAREAVAPARRAAYDVELAGCRIRIVSEERVRLFFADYLAVNRDDAPAFVVEEPTEEDMAREGLPDTWADRLRVLHERLCGNLLPHDILLFHGSALMLDGRAYLFAAPSGTGKSTHAALWRALPGKRVTMLSDDKPWLRIEDGAVMAYGSPWAGKHNLHANVHAPLAALCFLEQAEENRIEPLTPKQAVVRLLSQIYYWRDAGEAEAIMRLTDALMKRVPAWLLRCEPTLAAARLSCETLTGKALEEQA